MLVCWVFFLGSNSSQRCCPHLPALPPSHWCEKIPSIKECWQTQFCAGNHSWSEFGCEMGMLFLEDSFPERSTQDTIFWQRCIYDSTEQRSFFLPKMLKQVPINMQQITLNKTIYPTLYLTKIAQKEPYLCVNILN